MKKEKSTLAGVGAALLAVLGSVTCCGAPIIAGILASVGIGASQLSFLHSVQPYLIAIALISLSVGFYRLYFKKSKSCCGTNSESTTSPNNRKSKVFLWIVSVLTVGLLTYTNNMNAKNDTKKHDSYSKNVEESCCSKPQTKTSCCPSKKE